MRHSLSNEWRLRFPNLSLENKMTRKKNIQTNPLTRWLLEYIDDQEISITALSLKCGLSAGSLRMLVNFPERHPSIETCLRLAEATGKPVEEIMGMGGLDGTSTPSVLHPDRVEMIKLYDRFPSEFKTVLLLIARTLEGINTPNAPAAPRVHNDDARSGGSITKSVEGGDEYSVNL
jgi:hypothetical protein